MKNPPAEPRVLVLRIAKSSVEIWNEDREAMDYEFNYYYTLNSQDMGQKQVDGWTRNTLVAEIYHIGERIYKGVAYDQAYKKATYQRIVSLGRNLFGLVLSSSVARELSARKYEYETLYIETTEYDLPWELLHDGRDFLASRYRMGRIMPRSKPVIEHPDKRYCSFCLLGNPTSDLPSSEEEIKGIQEALNLVREELTKEFALDLKVDSFVGQEVSKERVLFDILLNEDCEYDVIHYSGHSEFREHHAEGSALVLANADLKAFEIEQMVISPILLANSCSSASVAREAGYRGYGLLKGLAPAFIKAGGRAFVGPLWPVDDEAAAKFAYELYALLLQGASIGEAMHSAKDLLHDVYEFDTTWLAYVLFGDPDVRLPLYQPEVTIGPYVNDVGIERIYNLELVYNGLEMLMVNDLPWILWSLDDFYSWVDKIDMSFDRQGRAKELLKQYRAHFRSLVLEGHKTFQGIVNLETFSWYLKYQSEGRVGEIIEELRKFSELPNFVMVFYGGEEPEIEELEIISKNRDPRMDLRESVYVFNKQTRFEKSRVYYYLFNQFNPVLIEEYVSKFENYFRLSLKQYAERYSAEFDSLRDDLDKLSNKQINEVTLYVLQQLTLETETERRTIQSK